MKTPLLKPKLLIVKMKRDFSTVFRFQLLLHSIFIRKYRLIILYCTKIILDFEDFTIHKSFVLS